MTKNIFVNRTLNLKQIKYIGLDMDHTLVRYNSKNFEELAYRAVLQKLVVKKGYPKGILELEFNFESMIRGLVLDRALGNILKLNRYSGIRMSQHGLSAIDFRTQKKIYKSKYIDLGDMNNYYSIDTIFSISPALLFGQLVDLKDNKLHNELPHYSTIAEDILECLDESHSDGSIKDDVRKRPEHYVYQEPQVIEGLERYKEHGKKIFIITNSDFSYAKFLLDHTVNPFLKKHKHWSELFEFVITLAKKPRFFYENLPFYKVDLQKGVTTEIAENITPGVYQGGCAKTFTDSLDLSGDDILYIGDHIYGDILRLKKDCNWRTGLIVEEIAQELANLKKALPIDEQITKLMDEKSPLEEELLQLTTLLAEGKKVDSDRIQTLQTEINDVDTKISKLIEEHKKYFNPHWGEIMRIGSEESYFASQVERYACIYMSSLQDLLENSPRTYFRGHRKILPHEVFLKV